MLKMTGNSQEFLVVGSGFAGLIAGITLYNAKIPVRVFEANESRLDVGDRITLFPNAMKVLRLVGVADAVIQSGFVIEVAKIQDNFGNHMVYRSMGTQSIYGEPTVTIRRSKVHEIVYNKAKELGIGISHGKKVVGVKENEDGAQLDFADGTMYSGSAVIGCDGINSFLRGFVLDKDIQPNYAGIMYFGGYVDNQELIKKLGLGAKTHYISIGPTNFFSYSYVDNPEIAEVPTLMWNCYLSQPDRLRKEELDGLQFKEVINRVHLAHKGWHAPVEELILNAKEVSKGSVSDIVQIDNWHKGRVIVVGDAAHAQNPFFGGQGAGTAMEDAYMLAKIIEKFKGNYTQAFPVFEKVRRERTTLIAQRARKGCKQSTIKLNKYLVGIRNRVFSVLTFFSSEKRLNPFLSYDVAEELDKLK